MRAWGCGFESRRRHFHQIHCAMKTRILLSLLLVISVACSKDSAEPETSAPKASISMALDYENREYELGETVEATLTIKEKNAAADYFLLNASCNGGNAVATVDGSELQWQAEQQIPYEIVNEEFSSKVLHLKITPQAGATAEQPFSFGIYVTSADGTEIKDRIYANSINSAPIMAEVQYQPAPIELEQQLEITLCAGKEQFTGEFSVKPAITGGDGYLIIDGRNYNTGDRFKLKADTPCPIYYQPMTSGSHSIQFNFSDGVCSAEEVVPVEVFNQGGVVKPQNGIYIYTADGLYFSRERWLQLDDTAAFKPIGVAIVADKTRFMLADKYHTGSWCGDRNSPINYPAALPEITWAADKATAIEDFDGRKNTEAMLRAYEEGRVDDAQAARFCNNYDPDEPGKWYFPAAGQMYLIYENLEEVQKCIKICGGQQFEYNYYYHQYASSTGSSKNMFWCLSYGNTTSTFYIATSYEAIRFFPVCDL